jgi:glycosyltransferase involved in cell wall biosynthesis
MRLLAKIFERLAFRLSSVVFCHSKTEFCRWSDLYKNKLHYIPASYESKNFYLEDGERDLVIWAGRFETVKNPVFANRVLTSLKIPGIKASMYGSGSLFAEVERANKISGNPITINAAVSSEDLGKILRRTKVLISTSHFEGAPRILVEALASGARIVCLSSADPHDYASEFPNDCIHQEQVEVESMVKKIESLIQREHLAHVNIEHYSNTRVFGILRRIFHEQLD